MYAAGPPKANFGCKRTPMCAIFRYIFRNVLNRHVFGAAIIAAVTGGAILRFQMLLPLWFGLCGVWSRIWKIIRNINFIMSVTMNFIRFSTIGCTKLHCINPVILVLIRTF